MTDVRSCLRSGYCCKKALCPFGEWNEDETACRFLEGHRPGEYSCGRHDWIVLQPGSEFSPAFGAGCCSPLNTDRRGLGEPLEERKKMTRTDVIERIVLLGLSVAAAVALNGC